MRYVEAVRRKEVKTSLLSLIKAAKAALVPPPPLDFDVREVALDPAPPHHHLFRKK
ncbi:hypothetical protein IPG36_00620 [bacterium]|nr:MAG: hypothetical protein IPG36_00620 [bacterium]